MDDRRYFNLAWRICAKDGICRGFGGMEYKRVFLAWLVASRPKPVVGFIRYWANIMPLDYFDRFAPSAN